MESLLETELSWKRNHGVAAETSLEPHRKTGKTEAGANSD